MKTRGLLKCWAWKLLFPWIILGGLLHLVAATSSQQAEETPYVGSDVCRACHISVWELFPRNPHFQTLKLHAGEPELAGCEGCHGPGREHILGGGDISKIRSFRRMPATEIIDQCLRCHRQDIGKAQIERSEHTLNGVACTSCHSIHTAETTRSLLARTQRELCYGCHPQIRTQFSMPFKHRVNEGLMECTDCHNPHGAEPPSWRMNSRPALVRLKRGTEEPCLDCHFEKRGPFVFEHPAVRFEGCVSCHVPHGSTNARLLKRPVVFTLCLECHTGAGRFGRQADGITIQSAAHNMLDPRYQSCTACHVQIHGSNADRRFLR